MVSLIKKGGAYVARKMLPLIIKGFARKIIGTEAVEEFIDLSDKTDEEVEDFIGEVAQESFARNQSIKKSIELFKNQLADTVKKITKQVSSEDKQKLIIFVDELDRCKPTYALQVLECIKHLFSVEGVIFILSIDQAQLQATIEKSYGLKGMGEGYLRKFIDWQLTLPEPSKTRYSEFLYNSFSLGDVKKLVNGDDLYKGKNALINAFAFFSDVFNLSLRQQAYCYTQMNLYLRELDNSSGAMVVPYSQLLPLITILNVKFPEQTKDFVQNDHMGRKFLEFISSYIKTPSLRPYYYAKWEDFAPTIQAYFLNKDGVDILKFERRNVIDKQNKASEAMISDEKRNELSKKYKHLQLLLGTYDSMDRRFKDEIKSFALVVYERLERASYLVSKDNL